MRLGFDYAWATLTPAQIKAAGGSFVCRYLSNDPSKNLSPSEAHTLRNAGIDVVAVWETTATRALAGEVAGEADARTAEALALACGAPPEEEIYFAVDFDASPPQQAAINAYFRGVNSVLGKNRAQLWRGGMYGGYWPGKRALDAGVISYLWQTYAWSGGNLDPRAQLYQYSNNHSIAGVGVDYNHALKPDFGQFGYNTPVPKPVPVPPLPPVPKPPAPTPPPTPAGAGFNEGFQVGFNQGFQKGFQDGWKARG